MRAKENVRAIPGFSRFLLFLIEEFA